MGKINTLHVEDFTVTDTGGNLVTGLSDIDFTKKLYNPSGSEVSLSVIITVIELGNGNYRATFTPDAGGKWYLNIYNATYFPWGKSTNIEVTQETVDSIALILLRTLGLAQENYYVYNTVHDSNRNLTSSRIRIYDLPINVGTDLGVIGEYQVTATYTNKVLNTYKVVKL